MASAGAAFGAEREQDLQSLRTRIDALSRSLQEKEEQRSEARDALRASERAISEANRALAAAEAESARLRVESGRIAERRAQVAREAVARQAGIERMLLARQSAGTPDALRVLLSGDDPGLLAHELHYLPYVSGAAAELLRGYRAALEEFERLAREARTRRERSRALEEARRTERARILAERKEKRRVFDRAAVEIRRSRREIKVLRADEARLARLVEEIGRVVYARVSEVPESASLKAPFSSLRGKLRFPVRGELTGRFGAPRGAAGAESKGVFIRAPEGQPVRAVAAGQVVYADWMRGFGNLLIVDHGEKYLSIYANNESLLKQVGDAVAQGEPVATTGASGGNEETGLYFELRHLGRAFDPLRWVKLK
ncbi:MAG TPA: peptidoglycan DD-metalloendopeptidase family protein [Burkholderiales bacterium]|nr:peptidoglycan DD-metalloendopeptidase family protein [Burkholderiales bacterium]